jgi:hypothetical protein
MEKTTALYGSWRSPVTAKLLAAASVHLGFLHTTGKDVYWI